MRSNVCFLPMVSEQSNYYLRLYRHYVNRILPHSGGILEQRNIYVQAMEIIERAINNAEER